MKEFPKAIRNLSERDVHIWKFDIAVSGNDLSEYEERLDSFERERASRFRFSEDRDRFLCGRILLRQLLGTYLHKDPASINLHTTPKGKPVLETKEDQQMHFNISHSGDLILLGFSLSPVGVDVEKVSRQVDIDKVSKNYFSDTERQMIKSASRENKAALFFDIWTKKEAVIKGLGKGLGISLNSFNVLETSGCVKWEPENRSTRINWYVHAVDTNSAYKAAFATPVKDVEISYFSLNE
ncbi:MAG: 4'-phosphopantetheinyl transferase superfamily protein [Gracilimonas sp.]|nr:4'-phosphopantetheinyl transferase superfamily protein [Gracilimonas sp.]